jgi:acetyltransferase-like isoleucine patch superfamily enzyme
MTRDQTIFIHDQALVESDAIGPRTRIWAFAHVMKDARIGADCNICDHAFIESGAFIGNRVTVKNCVLIWDRVTVEDDVFLGPNMVFCNDPTPRAAFKKDPADFEPTLVRHGATIGANATVLPGLTIGEWAFIGAGSVVTGDVRAHALLTGNPARRVGWACTCGQKLPDSLNCPCGRTYKLKGQTLTPDPSP